MISDEERKRAVKFLRERECIKLDCHECYQMSEMVLGRQNALCAIDEQWGALADLIERPTCDVRMGVTGHIGVCTRCGAMVEMRAAVFDAIEALPTRYCPNCGAEVIPHAERRD